MIQINQEKAIEIIVSHANNCDSYFDKIAKVLISEGLLKDIDSTTKQYWAALDKANYETLQTLLETI